MAEAPKHIPTKLYRRLQCSARAMRHAPTPAEDALWQALRNRQLHGSKWRRQHPILTYIVDFYCANAALVIEVDGGIHQELAGNDILRQTELASVGLRLLRFTNDQVLHDLSGVLVRIAEALDHTS